MKKAVLLAAACLLLFAALLRPLCPAGGSFFLTDNRCVLIVHGVLLAGNDIFSIIAEPPEDFTMILSGEKIFQLMIRILKENRPKTLSAQGPFA